MTFDEALKRDHEIINAAWQFIKKYSAATGDTWEAMLNDEFLGLYRKYDAAHDDFAHKLLDAALGEVQKHHENGGAV